MDDHTSIRVLIADDERPARRELNRLLTADDSFKIIHESENGIDAYEQSMILQPDLVFLDIQMPGMNGIEVARALAGHEPCPIIIFITAYDEFAIQAFELHALDYILKPIRNERFEKMLKRVHEKFREDHAPRLDSSQITSLISSLGLMTQEKQCRERISVYKGDKIIPICVDKILYAESKGRTCEIHTADDTYSTQYQMYELQRILCPPVFFASHRSFIMNTDEIESIEIWFNGAYRVRLRGAEELIPVSRGNAAEFKQLMNLS